MKYPIISFPIENELDIILAHKRASQLGVLTGLSYSEQTRFATAISEVCRNCIELSDRGKVIFEIINVNNITHIICNIIDKGPLIEDVEGLLKRNAVNPLQNREAGIINALRLVVFFKLESDNTIGTKVTVGFPIRLKTPVTKDLVKNWVKNFTEFPVSPYEELKYRNLQLINLYEELQKLVSLISHDLRNPVASLIGSTEFLKENIDSLDKESIGKFADIINKSSHRIYSQLDELLEWAKHQSQKKVHYPVKLQLLQVLIDAREILEDTAEKKGINIHNDIAEDIFVKADPLMLRSIFQNLITNSIKYTPQGGSIIISAKEEGEMARICVKDTGVGMTEEIKNQLFNNEFSSIAGTNNEKGTGMGLKLVDEFIKRNHGEIKVESDPDKGTTIEFTVPLFKK
jgi:signal transduction histidine kinase